MNNASIQEGLIRELGETSKRNILVELRLGPKSVSQLVHATGLKQPNVSNHLSRLRSRDLVRTQKVGRQIFYSLHGPAVAEALDGLLSTQEAGNEAPIRLDRETVVAFTKHIVVGDDAPATQIVDALVRSGTTVESVYENLFAQSLALIGEWWLVEAIDAGQEHLASAIIERLMARVMHFANPRPVLGATCVVGCCAGNHHSIGTRMVSDIMRLSGWHSIYLGANVPHGSFIHAAKTHSPRLVMISSSTPESKESLIECIRLLNTERGAGNQFCLGAGGRTAITNAELCLAEGADFVASDLTSLRLQVAESLVNGLLWPTGMMWYQKTGHENEVGAVPFE